MPGIGANQNDLEYDASDVGVSSLSSDNRAALVTALAAAAADRKVCLLPPGTLLVTLSGSNLIDVVSNAHVRGHAQGTTIKVNDDNGNYLTVFGASSGVTNVTFENLTIDQNYAGNDTCDISTTTGRQQFAMRFTGANTADVTIRNCRFDTCTGINTIAFNATGIKRITVDGNYFRFKKGTTSTTPGYDNTCVYIEGQNARVTHNRFYSDDYADCAAGAIEVHGALANVSDNTIDGFAYGVWIVSPFYSADQLDSSDVVVSDNVIARGACGIGLLCQDSTGTGGTNSSPVLKNVKITGNVMSMLQAGSNHDAKESWGVDVRRTAGTVETLTITNNQVTFEADTRSTSTRWGSLASFVGAGVRLNGSVADAQVYNNLIKRAPWTGFWIGNNTTDYVFDRVKIRRNTLVDCGYNENGTFKSLCEVTGVWTDGNFEDNEAHDTATGGTPNGTNSWRVYFPAAATRTYWRRNTRAMAGSGSLNDAWLVTTGLLSGPYEGIEAVTYAASVTPDPTKGATKTITLTGNITLANPSVSLSGMELTFILTQDGTGGRTTSFGSAYKDNFSPDTTASRVNSVTFRCDGTNWVQVAQATNLQ